MSRKFAICVMAILAVLVLSTGTAYASTVVRSTGYIDGPGKRTVYLEPGKCVTIEAYKTTLTTSSQLRTATTGGTPTYSGSAILWVKIRSYSQGILMSTVTSRAYWSWYRGVVTRAYWMSPYITSNFPGVYFTGTNGLVGGYQTWNYNYRGQYYLGRCDNFNFALGGMVVGSKHLYTDDYLHGDGTWRWRTWIVSTGL